MYIKAVLLLLFQLLPSIAKSVIALGSTQKGTFSVLWTLPFIINF